ncbi:MAG: hypothetical protein P8X74_15205 [Reinekea sp.]|jgi:hypothetical protein
MACALRRYGVTDSGSIYYSKITGSPQCLGSKEESMACALCRYEITDSGKK